MKKFIMISILASFALLTGCASPYQNAVVFSNISAPLGITNNAASCEKTGSAQMVNILNLAALGDASVATAKKSAGITKVANVDYDYMNFLGIIQKTTTTVCGQ